jgi:DNA invertase Pin-like site-specific DNA recombinase
MLAVLGGLADVERDLIRTRTAEGRSRAQKRGHPVLVPVSAHGSASDRNCASVSAMKHLYR